MKNYKHKYYIGVEGTTNTVLHDIEITAKQYHKMIDDAENLLKQSIEENPDDIDNQNNKVEYDYNFNTYIKHVIKYMNCGSAMYLTIATTKDGYEWKH